MPERVLVAMSGGVDSSLAAARLVRQGFDVIGVTLHLWDYPSDASIKSRCCAPEDVHDARRVSDFLGIPHYAFDRRELFAKEVVDPFVNSYLEGSTPSPCVRCNRSVKLAELFQLARRLGAERIATGHYARVVERSGAPQLWRGRDKSKDQSYFLYTLDEARLSRLVFPLGESDKTAVRDEAVELGLPGAHKGESQELCFIPSGRYDTFVADRAQDRVRPGPILDETGRVVGQHTGIHGFTVGQRKKLGVALGQRAYVAGIEADTATVRLASGEAPRALAAQIEDLFVAADVQLPLRCEVQVRYRAVPVPALVRAAPNGAVAVFDTPVASVVQGQYAVFYEAERVLGGGLISKALSAAPAEAAPC